MNPLITRLLIAGGLAMLTACGGVAPYERELLADPLMSFSRDALADQHLQHVYEVREGARGASTSQGGGCGCN